MAVPAFSRATPVTPLLDWHQGGSLKTEAEKIFVSTRTTIVGAARSTMGIVRPTAGPA